MKRIAFIMSTFPTLTETFVAGEIKILMDEFPNSKIYSLRRPFDVKLHKESEELMKKTVYVDPIHSGACAASNFHWMVRRPRKYFGTLGFLIRHTLSNPVHFLKTMALYPQAVHIASMLKETPLNHLHAHWSGYPTTVALAVSRLTGLRFSFTSHACDTSMIKTMVKQKVQEADFVLTCTRDALRFLSTFLNASEMKKIIVNYHGSNLQKFRPELRRKHSEERPFLLAVADLHERKGFPFLLEALALLRKKEVPFACHIVGEGPQRTFLEKRIQELGLQEAVFLPGSMTQEKLIDDYYALADIFVLPCVVQHVRFFRKNVDLGRLKIIEIKMSGGEGIQKDGIPNVLVEAMGMKIPVVSTRVAGIPELIRDKENGLLVPPRDPEALSAALKSLIEDPSLQTTLGEKGYVRAHEAFDRSKNIQALVEIFREDGAPAASPGAKGDVRLLSPLGRAAPSQS